jgi:sugar-specific transcriptional regulator TrmB
LKDTEITVYLTLLERGHMGSADLSKMAKVHRPRLAVVIKALVKRGLVSEEKVGKRIHFKAVPPYVLAEQAKALLQETKQTLPELLALTSKQKRKDGVSIFHGEEGLALCFLDVVQSLKKGDIFYQINSAKDQVYIDTVVPETYRPIRDAKGLERKTITTRYVGSHKKPRLERSIRYIEESDEVFEHNVIQFIYGDKVALLDFNTQTATIIQNEAIAQFQTSIFLTLYKRLKD